MQRTFLIAVVANVPTQQAITNKHLNMVLVCGTFLKTIAIVQTACVIVGTHKIDPQCILANLQGLQHHQGKHKRSMLASFRTHKND